MLEMVCLVGMTGAEYVVFGCRTSLAGTGPSWVWHLAERGGWGPTGHCRMEVSLCLYPPEFVEIDRELVAWIPTHGGHRVVR